MMRTVLVLAGLLASATAANAITVVNGSFEIVLLTPIKSSLLLGGDILSLPGWKVTGGSIDIDDHATGGWQAADGDESVDLNGISRGGVQQTLHGLIVGTAYDLTFDLSGSYSGVRVAPNVMDVSATGAATKQYRYDLNNSYNSMDYIAETYAFVATTSNTVIKFNGLDNGDYGAVLDNVGIKLAPVSGGTTTTPEPATWAMMVAGFGLVGVSVRRRGTRRSVAA